MVTGRCSALTMPAVTVELRPERRAEGDDALADAQRLRGAERRRLEPLGALGVEHGEVVDRAAAHDGGVVAVAVLVDDLDRAVVGGGLGDDVVVGDDVPLAVEDEAGAGRPAVLAVVLRHDLHGAGQQRLGHRRDRAVVRLERRRRDGVRRRPARRRRSRSSPASTSAS